jgi:hypothetical protein
MNPNYSLNITYEYLCPILQEIMTDPVIAADGHTYQRESITAWIQRGNRRSPLNGNNLSHTILIQNLFAKNVIREYRNQLPDLEEIRKEEIRSNLEECII